MSQIVDDLRQVAIEIKTETQVGGNTAARVGGAFERVADALEGTQQIEDMDAAVAAVQQAAQENEQTIQNIVNSLAVVQTTGQSTSDVMSQKAVTDEITLINDDINAIINKTNYVDRLPLVTTTNNKFVWYSNGQVTYSTLNGFVYTDFIFIDDCNIGGPWAWELVYRIIHENMRYRAILREVRNKSKEQVTVEEPPKKKKRWFGFKLYISP
jgi:hypothetical protein